MKRRRRRNAGPRASRCRCGGYWRETNPMTSSARQGENRITSTVYYGRECLRCGKKVNLLNLRPIEETV